MPLISLIRTGSESALTVSGIHLPAGIDLRVYAEPSCVIEPLIYLGADRDSIAIALGDNGRVGLLFTPDEAGTPEQTGAWRQETLRRALAEEQFDAAAGWLADRLSAKKQRSATGFLAGHTECRTVRFLDQGQLRITSVRGNYVLVSFWNEESRETVADEAYGRFEDWVEAGLPDPVGLHGFHFTFSNTPGGLADTGNSYVVRRDILQVRQSSHGQAAALRLWLAPEDPASRPSLQVEVSRPCSGSEGRTDPENVVNRKLSGLGNISQNVD